MTTKKSAASVTSTDGATKTNDRGQFSKKRVPIATFLQYPPAGRRTMWTQLVLNCPRCHELHIHRTSEEFVSGWKPSGCKGRYLLKPAHSLRIPRQIEQLPFGEAAA